MTSDKKYCPECQAELDVNVDKCPNCGFTFIIQEKKEVTNAKVKIEKYDPVPGFVWTVISFLIPIVGFVLYFVFRKNRTFRAEHSKDGAVIGIIIYALVIIFAFFFR